MEHGVCRMTLYTLWFAEDGDRWIKSTSNHASTADTTMTTETRPI